MKKCPFCAEDIQDEAIVCRYCDRDLPQHPEFIVTTAARSPVPAKPKKRGINIWRSCLLVIVGALGVCMWVIFFAADMNIEPGGREIRHAAASKPTERPKLADGAILDTATKTIVTAKEMEVLTRIEAGWKFWIDPLVWHAFNYEQKRQFAFVCAVFACQCDDPDEFLVQIWDNHNGKKLAQLSASRFKVY